MGAFWGAVIGAGATVASSMIAAKNKPGDPKVGAPNVGGADQMQPFASSLQGPPTQQKRNPAFGQFLGGGGTFT